jgi:hypothetical protein
MPQTDEESSMAVVMLMFTLIAVAVVYYMFSKRSDLPMAEAVAVPGAIPQVPATHNFRKIGDKFTNITDLQAGLRKAGLESSDLIIGVDFTKSNSWQGTNSFDGKCLHSLAANVQNPYQIVIRAMGQCLESFDDDHKIPAFGFGDAKTRDTGIFSLNPNGSCNGFEEVLSSYSEQVNQVVLSGPTNFQPLIDAAANVARTLKSFHILLIIADGQVTAKKRTIESIVAATVDSPLSIIMVGVGDGPWSCMKEFDDELPSRAFDNFQFVEFTKAFVGKTEEERITNFCTHCLMEVPEQYKAICHLELLG